MKSISSVIGRVFLCMLFLVLLPISLTAEDSNLKQLQGKVWQWVRLVDPVETTDVAHPEQYTLSFSSDNRIAILADCNRAQASYEADETGAIHVKMGPVTMAACPPESKSEIFLKKLEFVARYFFEEGNLFIDMMADGGTFEFRPAAGSTDGIPVERVRFEPGSDTASIKGKITGYEVIDYQVEGTAGQTLSVELKGSNGANYFNVTAPGADSAMFIGSTSGNEFTGVLPADGAYTVRVYLMRSAARRKEVSTYTLQIGLKKASAE